MNSKRAVLTAALAAVATATAGALAAGPASAAVKVSSFKVTPASTDAGAHADVTVLTGFSYDSGSDAIKDVAVTLPPGLVGNATATVRCQQAQFNADACPAGSHAGTVSVQAAIGGLPADVTSSGDAYSLQPAGPEPARLGIVIRPQGGMGNIYIAAPVNLNPATGALTTAFQNLPTTLNGLSVRIDSMSLTLLGKVNGGAAFLTNPTSCNLATSTVSADSYAAPTTPGTASDSFTPTNCAALPFAPQVTATVTTTGKTGDPAELSTTVTQNVGEANISSLFVTLPQGLIGRQTTLFAACPAPQVSAGTCPPAATIGSIAATTPLLSGPLTGPVLVQLNAPSLPLLIAQLNNGSIHLALVDQTGLSPGGQLTNSFTGIPDVPVTAQTLTIAGGSGSLLVTGSCKGPQVLNAVVTSQSGATVSLAAPVTICAAGTHKVALHKKHKKKHKKHKKHKKTHKKKHRKHSPGKPRRRPA